ncbi:hypothetical protein [Hyphococcus sp.]|jgi:hypothetical protein|uniref:hypothetical protein n=1 Tax=Hyphococcus sp. TaxID=2038636 RepID=UPI003D119D57
MEDNDLPDFDADDLIEAMAEELRKDESAGVSRAPEDGQQGSRAEAVSGNDDIQDGLKDERPVELAR